jgi:hypothetical protein
MPQTKHYFLNKFNFIEPVAINSGNSEYRGKDEEYNSGPLIAVLK